MYALPRYIVMHLRREYELLLHSGAGKHSFPNNCVKMRPFEDYGDWA